MHNVSDKRDKRDKSPFLAVWKMNWVSWPRAGGYRGKPQVSPLLFARPLTHPR
jgi:hypothetical protein